MVQLKPAKSSLLASPPEAAGRVRVFTNSTKNPPTKRNRRRWTRRCWILSLVCQLDVYYCRSLQLGRPNELYVYVVAALVKGLVRVESSPFAS